MVKNKSTHLRLNEDEYYEIQKQSRINKINQSEYIRKIIFDWYPKCQEMLDLYRDYVNIYKNLLDKK